MTHKNRTTRQHYEKYKALAERAGVSMNNQIFRVGCALGTAASIRGMYDKHKDFREIPLNWFHAYLPTIKRNLPGESVSLADNYCILVHFLIYDVVGAEPEFTD
jgi:hypothetical protein